MTESRLKRIFREPVSLGLAGVLSMFVLVALWQALILPPYKPLDEPRHAAREGDDDDDVEREADQPEDCLHPRRRIATCRGRA